MEHSLNLLQSELETERARLAEVTAECSEAVRHGIDAQTRIDNARAIVTDLETAIAVLEERRSEHGHA